MTHRAGLLAVVSAFVVSRIIAYAAGVRFDVAPLHVFHQYLDPMLLADDLARSLWYLHTQPPLFNLLLGVLIKLDSSAIHITAWILWLICGATITVGLYRLMVELSVPVKLAVILVIAFIVSPAALMYENWLFYTYPVAAVIVVSALALTRYVRTSQTRHLVVLMAMLTVLCLTRTTFHLVWIVPVVAWLLRVMPGNRRRIATAGMIVLLIVGGWYLKNAVVFGQFTASTWLGMNVARITTMRLDSAERRSLIASGELSQVALIPPFSPLDSYPVYQQQWGETGIPALDHPAPSGRNNYNALAYARLSSIYAADAIATLRNRPAAYLDGAVAAYVSYLMPASDYWFGNDNARALGWYQRAYTAAVFWQPLPRTAYDTMSSADRTPLTRLATIGWGIVVMIAIVLVGSLQLLRGPRTWERVSITYMLATALWVTVVGNALDTGENNRFRFEIDPLWICLFGIVAARVFRKETERSDV